MNVRSISYPPFFTLSVQLPRFAVLFSALHLLGVPAAAESLIIESRSGGQNFDKYSEPVGAWRDSDNPPNFAKSSAVGLSPQGRVGGRKFVTDGASSSASDSPLGVARFTPDVPAPGRYRVSVTWPKGGNAQPVRYFVQHAGGSETVALTQDGFGAKGTSNAGQWHDLGQFDFSPGKDQFVELRILPDVRSVDSRNACQAFADGVRFSPVGEGSEPSFPAASAKIEWLDSLSAASARAGKENKKILVYFYAPASDRVPHYDKVFSDPAVCSLLSTRFIPVRLNLLDNADLAARMKVFKACTINFYDSKGEGLGQVTETISAAELTRRLNSL